jgi:hypothetical protein
MKTVWYSYLTSEERAAVSEHAEMYIEKGHSPDALCHILWHDAARWEDREAHGVSYPMPPGSDLSGHTERYYTLGELVFG